MTRYLHNQLAASIVSPGATLHRRGVAAVEFAFCLPLLLLLMFGLWEVGRIAQISNVMRNGAREAARDASLGQDNLQTVASNLTSYLQAALPTAFGQGNSTSLQNPTITLPANTTGYTCWDKTTNEELFTVTFTDITTPATTDPTAMQKLDHYQIGISVPYSTVGWTAAAWVTGTSRISITVDWASMRDAPFQMTPTLPAQ